MIVYVCSVIHNVDYEGSYVMESDEVFASPEGAEAFLLGAAIAHGYGGLLEKVQKSKKGLVWIETETGRYFDLNDRFASITFSISKSEVKP